MPLANLLLEMKRRRRENPLEFFKENKGDQELFSKSQKRGRYIIASNKWGKTEVGSVESLRYSLGKHPYRKVHVPSFGWVISLDYNVQRDVIQRKMQKYIPKGKVAHITYRTKDVWDRMIFVCHRCGQKPRAMGKMNETDSQTWYCRTCSTECSVIGFKSCDQGREKFQGTSLDWAWFDEEPPEDIYKETIMRLTDKKGDLWMTFTPIDGMTWTYDAIYQVGKQNDEIFGGSMYDNPHLDIAEIENIKSKYPDPAEQRIRIYGEYQILSGLIFKAWRPEDHEVECLPPAFLNPEDGTILEHYDVYCGIDTGRHFAATFWLMDFDGNPWGFDEYYAEDRPLRENAQEVMGLCRKWGVWPTFTLDGRSQHEIDLAAEGIPCTKSGNDIEAGLSVMLNHIAAKPAGAFPMMRVVAPNMSRWLWERARYQWDRPNKTGSSAGEAKNKPMKKDDHAIDSSRYVFELRPPASMPKGPLTEMTREQQMRARAQEACARRQAENAQDESMEDELW